MKQLISYSVIIVTLLMSNVVYAESAKRPVKFTKIEELTDDLGFLIVPFSLEFPPSGNLNGNTLYIEFNTDVSLAEVTIYKNKAMLSRDVVTITNIEHNTTYDLGQYGSGEYHVVIEFTDNNTYEATFKIE